MAYIEIKNQSTKELTVEVDCSKSENCIANNRDLKSVLTIKPEKSKIAMILCCKNKNKDWYTRCSLNVMSESTFGKSSGRSS